MIHLSADLSTAPLVSQFDMQHREAPHNCSTDFENESAEMMKAVPPVNLTKDLWVRTDIYNNVVLTNNIRGSKNASWRHRFII